jgi:uncharacterized protein (DUF433 family)
MTSAGWGDGAATRSIRPCAFACRLGVAAVARLGMRSTPRLAAAWTAGDDAGARLPERRQPPHRAEHDRISQPPRRHPPQRSPELSYRDRITIEPDKRSGQPCIRGLRITVYDILGYLAAGMSEAEILADFPDLETEDIRAALAFAADFDRRLLIVPPS